MLTHKSKGMFDAALDSAFGRPREHGPQTALQGLSLRKELGSTIDVHSQ